MKKNKDEQLNGLFQSYAKEGKKPDRSVTGEAKRALESGQTVPVLTEEYAVVGGGGKSGSFSTRKKAIVGVAAALMFCAVLLIAYFLLKQFLFAPANIVLDRTQLNRIENAQPYREQEFAPFVKENEVIRYDEFGLSEDSPYYEEYEGDIILYYLRYESYGVTVDLIVEIDGFTLEELSGYLEITDDYEAEELILYIECDDVAERTYVYFIFDIYQYYLEIHTVDADLIASVLTDIVYSF